MATQDDRKIWFVPHPTSQFKEDVKKLARMANLRIIDKKFEKEFDKDAVAKDAPKLTRKPKPKAKASTLGDDGDIKPPGG